MKLYISITIAILLVILTTNEGECYNFHKNGHSRRLSREPPPPPRNTSIKRAPVRLEYITQRVDNFDNQNVATYQMRYYRNDEFFKSGGPILIDIGGEWTITPDWLEGGHMYDIAKDLGAQMFYTEHRFYGQSRPTADLRLENLRYLSVDQALADLAHFVEQVKKEPGKQNSKVVVFGCSYAASMATWFRQKYPNLVVGAKASSAPLWAKPDFYEYKEVVGKTIREYGGQQCYNRVESAFRQAENLANNGGWNELIRMFQLCKEFNSNNQLDVWSFFAWIGYTFDGAVQNFNGGLKKICDDFLNIRANTDIEAYAKYIVGSNWWCKDVDFQTLVDYYGTTSWNSESAKYEDRQWTYQTCTEFGYFQTSASQYQPFGSSFPVNFDYQKCAYFYSQAFTPDVINANINNTNYVYGGYNPSVRNVYFTHGDIDPWRQVGLQYDLNADSPVDIVPGVAHCADLYSISSWDSPALAAAKRRAKSLVSKWLN